ncbi:MAG: CBS domain-containing protein, partial [Actinotalea sp.]|nr:CBS domain-containing protein [Actinotalea sp.]
IVTDRDLVVRVLAVGGSPEDPVRQACSSNLVTVTPDLTLAEAGQVMREHDVRRLPVTVGDELVGIVSIGDLAIEKDPHSTLADISAARPNS